MTSPYPGLSYPDPRTWEPGDDITVARLRGDLSNAAALMTIAKPVMTAADLTGVTIIGDLSMVVPTSFRCRAGPRPALVPPGRGAAPV